MTWTQPYLLGIIFVCNKLHKHCMLTWLVREEVRRLCAIAQISCKSVLWSVPPLQPQPRHPIDRRMDCNDSPRRHAQNYAPHSDTQLMMSAEKSRAFNVSVLWKCRSWHMIGMTDRGSFAENGAGSHCDQDRVYSKEYESFKMGLNVSSWSWNINWHHCWSNWLPQLSVMEAECI